MKKVIFIVIFSFLSLLKVTAQIDTLKVADTLSSAKDLLANVNSSTDSTALLPQKMPFTQKIFWGNKGLMRNFDEFKLSQEEREKELKIRRTMLSIHQYTGYATLAGMLGQGIVGAKLYKDTNNQSLRNLHSGLAGVVNGLYFSTAALALFSPPKMLDERKGYSSIKVHKILAIVHFTSMVAVNILASQLESNPNLKPYHRAAAYTAFGSLAAAMFIIKF